EPDRVRDAEQATAEACLGRQYLLQLRGEWKCLLDPLRHLPGSQPGHQVVPRHETADATGSRRAVPRDELVVRVPHLDSAEACLDLAGDLDPDSGWQLLGQVRLV